MHYSRDDQAWIERKATELTRERGWTPIVARSVAQEEFQKIQEMPKAQIIPLRQGRLFRQKLRQPK